MTAKTAIGAGRLADIAAKLDNRSISERPCCISGLSAAQTTHAHVQWSTRHDQTIPVLLDLITSLLRKPKIEHFALLIVHSGVVPVLSLQRWTSRSTSTLSFDVPRISPASVSSFSRLLSFLLCQAATVKYVPPTGPSNPTFSANSETLNPWRSDLRYGAMKS